MDRELAGAVLQRWEEGLPVAETTLYKAASSLGIDPDAALMEARFYTHLDRFLLEKRAMSTSERVLFSLAAGINPFEMVKTASRYKLGADELVLYALQQKGFVPDLEKLANLSAVGGDPTVAGGPGAMPPEMGAMPGGAEAAALGAPPQPGAAVQQQPQARFKPSPMAPDQVPPGPGGNLDALLQEHQQVFGQQAQENGGLPPAGQQQPPPPPPPAEERVKQVAPGIDEETAARYGAKLDEFEQQNGMPISDPKSMVKFVEMLQKVDAKRIDQGIKAFGQQLEQEQAAELGVETQPTVKSVPGAGGQMGAGAPTSAGATSPAGGMMGANGAGPPNGGQPPKQPKQPPQQAAPQQQAAAEKVANAARALARAQRR